MAARVAGLDVGRRSTACVRLRCRRLGEGIASQIGPLLWPPGWGDHHRPADPWTAAAPSTDLPQPTTHSQHPRPGACFERHGRLKNWKNAGSWQAVDMGAALLADDGEKPPAGRIN
jgi:hypothetical protein